MKRLIALLLVILWSGSLAFGQAAGEKEDVVMKAMRDELSRSISKLHLADLDKPYFISYRIDDTVSTKISAALGQLTDEDTRRGRKLNVEVRVGDYALDNTDFMNIGSGNFGGGNCGCHTTLPLDDDYDQIRREIWLETDAAYKQSAADLAAKRTVLSHRQNAQQLSDFTPQKAATVLEKPADSRLEIPALKELARDLSGTFHDSPEITTSGVDIYAVNEFVRLVNTEGAAISRAEPITVLDVRAYTQAADGQPLADSFRVYLRNTSELRHDELLARTHELITRLKALRTAKTLEAYNGPVLFEGEAAADVIGQVFAPAIVASRFPVSDQPQFEAQFQQVIGQFGGSLADRVGARVMPDGVDLTDDPTTSRFSGAELLGSYPVDDEAVPSQKVKIVENGRLVGLLATRTPTAQTKTSTGSARGNGAAPGNLFLTARDTATNEHLRKELLRVAQQRGYDYGIVVRHVAAGGLSALMRMAYSAGRAEITGGSAVYKVFADGHEEMVRGDIAPVALTAFKEILAIGDTPGVYHDAFMPFAATLLARGQAGQLIVVSYVVPSLLFEEVSLKQPMLVAPKPPLLPSPLLATTNASGEWKQATLQH
ncbi:MAG TPA: metallopeptidase TldD-related protein [Terriglobales bacterium]|nr:metallopeptidase TldD-related protein [Terriglobales bacterium]